MSPASGAGPIAHRTIADLASTARRLACGSDCDCATTVVPRNFFFSAEWYCE